MNTTRNVMVKYGSKAAAAVGALALSAGVMAQETIPSAAASLEALKGEASSYATPLFALAVVATGIMIGIKWIKRGKSAA
ncbi:hypothetical protein H9K76_00110 [Diaphorobacter ruginosibacter]|uniref:Phage coat protein n=1 Tax=Diaphorobacter ruginosibacter TaxID=1715720 RepID=A0A7G9RP27_9BURK|nr:hypothetical protein [Diaphorobacter ruginosibacter]QNN56250.1 hypothetical protein H9K76_17060 [Diaphorobacter ruginosibacter]QNN57352.1 hypothetical protein H9K76_00110 [Diaphorobacter ruginosibacter]